VAVILPIAGFPSATSGTLDFQAKKEILWAAKQDTKASFGLAEASMEFSARTRSE